MGALDYLLKPVPYFAFSQQLQKAVEKRQRRQRRYLAVPVSGGLRRLDVSRVFYIESQGHQMHFYTEDGHFISTGTLKALEEKRLRLSFCTVQQRLSGQFGPSQRRTAERGTGGAVFNSRSSPQTQELFGCAGRLYRRGGGSLMALPDIPRLYTALAEWLAVMVYAINLPKRGGSRLLYGRKCCVWAAVGRLFADDRGCAAGLVGALYGGSHRPAIFVFVQSVCSGLAGCSVPLCPGVYTG